MKKSILLKRKFTPKHKDWQYWIVFSGNNAVGLFFSTSENQAIMAYLIKVKYPQRPREEVVVEIDDHLKNFQLKAKPLGVGKSRKIAEKEYEMYYMGRKKFTDKEPPIHKIAIPLKFVQIRIPMEPFHQDPA